MMQSHTIETHSERETEEWARHFCQSLGGGDLVLLQGPLGAGKSVIARAIGACLGVLAWKGSPTFSLVHEYDTRPFLFHIDLYRLEAAEVEELGLEEYVRSDSLVVVEWADRADSLLRDLRAQSVIDIHVEVIGQDDRRLTISQLPTPPANAPVT